MHVLLVKHSYAWLPRKCDYWIDTWTDRCRTKWSLYATMFCRRHKYNNNHQIQGHNKLNSHKHETYIRLWAAAISSTGEFTACLACLTLRLTVWTHYTTPQRPPILWRELSKTSQWPHFLLCNVHRNRYNLLGNSVYHQSSKRPGKGTVWKSPYSSVLH